MTHSISSLLPRARRGLLCLSLSVTCLLPLTAAAQASPADKAMAEGLFDRGLALMRQGQYAEACTRLERSQAVEPGIGTMLYLAECYERQGRTASAWALFREAASAADAEGQSERAQQGLARADALEPQLSKLTIRVPEPAPGLELLRNGEPVSNSVFGTAVPMDPGEHRFEAQAVGYSPWHVTVILAAHAATLSVDVPALEPLPAAQERPSLAARSRTPAGPANPLLTAATPSAAERSVQGPIGVVLSGLGLVGLGVGAYFGVRALNKNRAAEATCPDGVCSSARGAELDAQAHSAAMLSNGFVIGGAAALVTGAVLYFTRPSERAPTLGLRLSPRAAAVVLGGTL